MTVEKRVLPRWLQRRLPRTLRGQAAVALWAIVALIAAGSSTALYALRRSAATTSELAGERLARMQEAQELVEHTLLVERLLVLMVNAASPEDVRRNTAAIVTELDELDELVGRLGAESADVEILALHESAQLFRNGVHVLAALRTEAVLPGARLQHEERLRRSRAELERETLGMMASAEQLSARLSSDYSDAVTGLALESQAMARWAAVFLAGGVVLAWLAFRYLLGRQIVDRLQEVSRHLRHGGAGERPRVPVYGSDEIADMARAIEQLLADRQRLAEANRELEALSYSVSHDLRAPIRHVEAFAELLRGRTGGSLDEESRHYLDVISEAGRRMGAQVDDLLSLLSLRHAGMALTEVDLRALVREVVTELAPEIGDRAIEWRIGELPCVRCDRRMVGLALGALLSNAVKFTRPCARAEIEVGRAPHTAGGDEAIFVRDNGVGFDMKYADKLYRVFHRLHKAEEFHGTGAGLAIVRRVVELHGGRTWAEGAPDMGATFFLSFPRREREAD